MKREILGIYGGTFNPITRAHVKIADELIRTDVCQHVCIMPNNDTNGKNGVVDFSHRLKMCQLASQGIDNITVSNFENQYDITGGTYEVVKTLTGPFHFTFSGYDPHFIVGHDAANDLLNWQHADELIKMISFIVVARYGEKKPSGNEWYMQPPHQFVNHIDVPTISSTQVRTWIMEKKFDILFHAVPFSVLDYIYHHNLYRIWY